MNSLLTYFISFMQQVISTYQLLKIKKIIKERIVVVQLTLKDQEWDHSWSDLNLSNLTQDIRTKSIIFTIINIFSIMMPGRRML